ncbi:MAG: HD-GYP domain-containing protein [Bacillota bacterium]
MRGSKRKLQIYVSACIAAGGILFLVFDPFPMSPKDLQGLTVMGLLIFVSEHLAVPLPRGGGSVSVSSPLIYTTAMVYGPSKATWLACLATISARELAPSVPRQYFLFNRAAFTISTAIAGSIFQWLGGVPGSLNLQRGVIPLVACALTYTLVNAGLVMTALSLQRGVSFRTLWRTNFMWSIPSLLALVPLAAIMSGVLVNSGPVSIALFFLPLLAARQSFGRYIELRQVFLETIRALVRALDAKDPCTRGHSERVARLSAAVGRALRLPEQEIELLEYIGLLHDIGKVAIRDAVLKKPGIYTINEYIEMKAHPTLGADIITGIKMLGNAASWVRYHHEWYNGTGFPEGLKGNQIPLGARIISVADAFDAMISERPYKSPLPTSRAIEELQRCAGTQFDPEVVKVMISCWKELEPGDNEADQSKV